jgi:hypothetical protein
MPTTYAIPDGRTVMAATTYTGTGASLAVSNAVNGVSFQPDFVWIKLRNQGGDYHNLFDVNRGVYNRLFSNDTGQENTNNQTLTSFNSNGFTVGTNGNVNTSTINIVGWNWKAGTTSASNTNGTITSTVSAGATQGFSVVTYTGNGTNGATIGHGLGATPSMIIVKDRGGHSNNWAVWNSGFTTTSQTLFLDLTVASTTYTNRFDSSGFTSSVFKVGTTIGEVNTNTYNYVAYCFSAVAGYSAFGTYSSNASSDGPFVYLGFRPRWIMIKKSSGTTNANSGWYMFDTSRGTYNVVGPSLRADLPDQESTFNAIDFLSNGFKIRVVDIGVNGSTSGDNYIYAAFAENPFKYANAR